MARGGDGPSSATRVEPEPARQRLLGSGQESAMSISTKVLNGETAGHAPLQDPDALQFLEQSQASASQCEGIILSQVRADGEPTRRVEGHYFTRLDGFSDW